MLILGLLSFLVIEGMILYHAKSQEKIQTDYAIILGAGLWGEDLSLTLFHRLNESLEYLKAFPETKVVVSGGQGPGENITEAEAMKRFLMKNGIDEGRILLEDKSTSTYENMLFSSNIIEREEGTKNKEVIIITSDFHMLRAKMLASRVGLIPYGISSDSVDYLKPYYYSREYLAIIKSFLIDW